MGTPDDYYCSLNPELLSVIPPDAKTILEVGCGAGALAREYKLINPDCNYWGIEQNPDVARQAETLANMKVVARSMETVDFPHFSTWFDAIIFGDVLEHMADPWSQLKKAAGWLSESGQILASIPNTGNYNMILSLIAGRWDYQDCGLLDRTHLRFFTLKSIRELFESAGLTIIEVIPRSYHLDGHDDFVQMIKPLVERVEKDFEEFREETRAWQYIIRASKQPAPANRILLRAFPAEGCCAPPRLRDPGQMIATLPEFRYSESPTKVGEDESVIVIRQRANWDLEEVRSQIAAGCIIVGEWDDDPEYFLSHPNVHPVVERFRGFGKLPFYGCHALQCSTSEVANSLWGVSFVALDDHLPVPEIAVFPNQLTKLSPPREHSGNPGGGASPVRIFFGAQNRQADWAAIMPAINEVTSGRQDVEFHVVHDREFYDALAIDRKFKKFYAGFLPYHKYREVLRKCDIALLPLENTRFNRHKSDIKFLECAAEGVVPLCSDVVYMNAIYLGDGLYYNAGSIFSAEEFEANLRLLIDKPKERQEIADSQRRYVTDSRLLKSHYRDRAAWYRSLVLRRDELTADLKSRAPELF